MLSDGIFRFSYYPSNTTNHRCLSFLFFSFLFIFAEGNREYMTKLIAESVCNILSMN